MERFNQLIVDAAQMAGDINIYDRIVGRTLYKNLIDAINQIAEPCVLIVDFRNINQAQDSVLLISIIRAMAFCRKSNAHRVIACANISDLHRRELQESIILWPDASDPWGDKPDQQKRMLLLVSGQDLPGRWELLGELVSGAEQDIWTKMQETDHMALSDLAEQMRMNKLKLMGHLSVFIENYVLLIDNEQNTISRLSDWIAVEN